MTPLTKPLPTAGWAQHKSKKAGHEKKIHDVAFIQWAKAQHFPCDLTVHVFKSNGDEQASDWTRRYVRVYYPDNATEHNLLLICKESEQKFGRDICVRIADKSGNILYAGRVYT